MSGMSLTGVLRSRLVLPFVCLGLAGLIFAQGNAPATVTVRVTGAANEELIDQAEVRLFTFGQGVPTHRNYTDGGGRVTFAGVMRGSYYVEVEKPGYEPVRENIDVNPGANQSFYIHLSRLSDSSTKRAIAATVSASSLAAPAAARKEFDKGVASMKTDPAESIGHFREATKLFDGYAEAWMMLGLALMRHKELDDAGAALIKAIQLEPKLAAPRTLLANLYIQQRRFAEAERALLDSIFLDPQAWDAEYELARCYFKVGDVEKALVHALRAQSLPQAATTTHLLLADIYLLKGDEKNALKELNDFAKADPNSPFIPRVKQQIDRLKNKR
jgi:tetratricopeptide (TPR) repeat protein